MHKYTHPNFFYVLGPEDGAVEERLRTAIENNWIRSWIKDQEAYVFEAGGVRWLIYEDDYIIHDETGRTLAVKEFSKDNYIEVVG